LTDWLAAAAGKIILIDLPLFDQGIGPSGADRHCKTNLETPVCFLISVGLPLTMPPAARYTGLS
jgi:hypothetical protein